MHLLDEMKAANKPREWRWQRIGWGFMVFIVLAEVVGAFGGGPVATTDETVERDGARYSLRYDSWNRHMAASFLNVVVDAPGATGDTLKVAFSDRMTTGWMIRTTVPAADGSSLATDGQTYEFQVDDWNQTVIVTFDYLARETGVWSGNVIVQAGDRDPVPVRIEQRIFPCGEKMDLFLRTLALYLFIFIFMRAAGNRQFSKMTAFDAVLIIIIAEVTGQAFIGEDYSVTGAVVVVATLVALDIGVSIIKLKTEKFRDVVDGMPTLLVDKGRLLEDNMRKERVVTEDILAAARQKEGLESLGHVKYAVLEPGGEISIIPWETGKSG